MNSLDHGLLFAEATQGGSLAAAAITMLIPLAIAAVAIAGLWKMFTKAGMPGWGAIVPIYNMVLLLKIAERPVWWLVLFLIPIVNFVAAIVLAMDIAKKFGKGVGFGLGLAFLGFIFYPILGLGRAEYQPSL